MNEYLVSIRSTSKSGNTLVGTVLYIPPDGEHSLSRLNDAIASFASEVWRQNQDEYQSYEITHYLHNVRNAQA